MIDLLIESQQVMDTLNRLVNINISTELDGMTQQAVKFVKGHFNRGMSPDGTQWSGNKGIYHAWKIGALAPLGRAHNYGSKPLILTGELRDSIYGYVRGDIGWVDIENTMHSEIPEFPWGNTRVPMRKLGIIHHYGTSEIEARPFMGLGTSEVDMIVGMLNKRFDDVLGGV